MEFKSTEFYFFYDECIERFGEREGKKISDLADEKLSEMKSEADYRDSDAIEYNMNNSLLPGIAMYLAFKKAGFTKDKAYKNTFEIVQRGARELREESKKELKKEKQLYSSKSGFYEKFKADCESEITKNFPEEGWSIEFKQCDEHEVHFDVKRCIYMETTEKYNCPEVCKVFCEHDTTVFSAYAPKIIFKRTGTIGEGQEICDFHFINGESK